uniref:Uncharacterized protein n=1 Tax=Papio anubis TaxID=9555 RepID=A0A8I5N9F5_PAPAN
MAEKRPLRTLGPVMYGKLPRLETDSGPEHSLPHSVGNQDPCTYKGSYFSCPMAGTPKAESEQLASWTPYPPLYSTSMAGPPLRTDNLLTNCLFYRSPAEGSEKMQDSSPVELLPFSPQGHSYPSPPLAAPKPVYRNPLCYGLSTCLGEGAVKRPLDVDWTLVTGPLLPSADPPCSLAPAPSKGQTLDGTFLRGVPAGGSSKDSSGSFSPCQPFLEKYQTIHSTGFLASRYTGPYPRNSKQVMSEGPSPWTQLAQPLGPPCQDTGPTHYPPPHPPQALPCPPACRHPEKQAPSPGLKLEPPLAPRCPLDFAPQTLSFPYARDDLSLYGASPGLGGTPPSQNNVRAVSQPGALQRACQPLPASQPCSEPVRPAQEAEEKTWMPSCRKEQLQPRLSEHSGPPIVIRDSPIPCTPPALPPCATTEPDSATAEPDSTPATNEFQDKGCRGTPPAQEGPSGSKPLRGSLKEEVALDLSVRKPTAEASHIKAPSPVEHAKPTAAMDVPDVGNMVSDLPGLKKIDTEAPGLPGVPVTADAMPSTNFHSSVAFMFRKFKILRPAPLPAAVVPSTPTSAPAPTQPAPTPTSGPIGLRILAQQPLSVTCFSLALPSSPAVAVASPAPAPVPSPAPAPAQAPASARDPAPAPVAGPAPASTSAPGDSPEQHFTGLHASLCDAISGSVAHSPPEKLREWLETAGPWGQAAWQDCQGVQGLLTKLLSQLQRFDRTHRCPFPHVVRAGAIFVPIHLVKERLFPRLPPASVDHVLQEHRVELRPTTLSEERALRELALPGCTSRMLKLLALRQLPDIYPDLLGLQWRDCVRRQLGDFDTEAGAVSSSEPTLARDEPESLALARKSPAPKVRKPGRKPPTPGPEKGEAAAGEESCAASPTPAACASPPGPTLKARFRSLLETAWLNGLALPTWGHKSRPDRPSPCPQLLDSQSHHL